MHTSIMLDDITIKVPNIHSTQSSETFTEGVGLRYQNFFGSLDRSTEESSEGSGHLQGDDWYLHWICPGIRS